MGTTPHSLVSHGIQSEDSDWRVHVCPQGRERAVFFFRTQAGVAITKTAAFLESQYEGGQPGVEVVTFRGGRVPWQSLGAFACHPPGWVWEGAPRWSQSPSEKGQAAEKIVLAILENGYVPVGLPFCAEDLREVTYKLVSRWTFGHDIRVWRKGQLFKLEVKCDMPGAQQGLHLQTAESNPLKRH